MNPSTNPNPNPNPAPAPFKTFSKEAVENRKGNATKATGGFYDQLRENLNKQASGKEGTSTTPNQAATNALRDFSADASAKGKKGPPAKPQAKKSRGKVTVRYTALFVESAKQVDAGVYRLTVEQ